MRFVLARLTFALWLVSVAAGGQSGTSSNSTPVNYGSVLFSTADIHRDCWTPNDMALLTSHMLMRSFMPQIDLGKPHDDTFVNDIIDYLKLLLDVIRERTAGKVKHVMLLAFTDTLGGYMKHVLLPVSKYSYYAGNLQYVNIIKLYQLYDEIKNYLRTNGLTWSEPMKNAGKHITAKSLTITTANKCDPCKSLIYFKKKVKGSEEQTIEFPMPFFDSRSHPSAVALPLRAFSLRNLESKMSAYVLVKFYVSASKCLTAKTAAEADVRKFNYNMLTFVMTKVLPHLHDDKFYSAFGGVLRILETVKQKGGMNKEMGGINIMPELEQANPLDATGSFENDEDQGDVMVRPKSHKKVCGGSETSKLNWLLIVLLVMFLIWLCVGAIFIYYKLYKKKVKTTATGPAPGDFVGVVTDNDDTCMPETCPRNREFNDLDQVNYALFPTFQSNTNQSSKTPRTVQSTHSSKSKSSISDSKSSSKSTKTKATEAISSPVSPRRIFPIDAFHRSTTASERIEPTDESKMDIKPPYIFGYEFLSTEDSTSRESSEAEVDQDKNFK